MFGISRTAKTVCGCRPWPRREPRGLGSVTASTRPRRSGPRRPRSPTSTSFILSRHPRRFLTAASRMGRKFKCAAPIPRDADAGLVLEIGDWDLDRRIFLDRPQIDRKATGFSKTWCARYQAFRLTPKHVRSDSGAWSARNRDAPGQATVSSVRFALALVHSTL